LAAGHLLFGGHAITAPNTSLWDVPVPDTAFSRATQSCKWLDDMAAAADATTRKTAQIWVWDWIKKYGQGTVIDTEGAGKSSRIQVNFNHAGSKWLVLAYAKLEKI
jgi:uncharacterized heparinase superfamily protein